MHKPTFDENGDMLFRSMEPITSCGDDELPLPRQANIELTHLELRPSSGQLTPVSQEHLQLSPVQYNYILELLRLRAQQLKEQPHFRIKEDFQKEREFVVNLLCHMDT